jgi:hypothetical protein
MYFTTCMKEMEKFFIILIFFNWKKNIDYTNFYLLIFDQQYN